MCANYCEISFIFKSYKLMGKLIFVYFNFFQTEIAKRLNAICAQIIPFLSQDVSIA